ncbi:MFS transporter [Sphingomonas ursincola]|jgi:MFS family permease|uniref:MHS family MFS transporter n=1 Tax=Sphingomonas ursincola TaxID=56361 RepID=A0A7V8RD66_9SPHN|nr:MFS transporter [Sphingomonas ursincola]MBA1374253.1 MHS family MFS transporter [Sphingomonas ursincola]MBA4780018.1 MFS transporter [Blastomonas sp.]MBY0618791.1 MFS transporter [Sphingomonas ursincola]MCH2237645.1 MFS transporter [Blastomonas sp.]
MVANTVPTTEAERDARAINDDGHSVGPGEIAIGVVIGRTSEFFDFFVYAIASVLVFPKLVFPYLDPLEGTLWSFAIFALAFVARPAGTMIFTAVDRAYGRGAKLTIALFLLGGSTAAIAFLPGHATIGIGSALLLALFRMGQGVALGGSWDGLASLLALNAPKEKRGWYAMIPQLGAPFGLIVASLLFAFLISALPAEDFLAWGWRYPFFVAFAINVVALFARLRIVVTPEYTELFESQTLQPEPVFSTVRSEWKIIVLGAFAPLASFAMFHMVTVYPLSWVFLFTEESPVRFLLIEAVAAALGVLAILASGRLADAYGRRTLLAATAVAIAAFSGFAPQLLDAGGAGEAAFMFGGFILLGLAFGQSSGALSSFFPLKHRYTGSALTSDLAWLFGAGFAPMVALWLSANYGLLAAGAYLLSGALATLTALWFNRELGQQQ